MIWNEDITFTSCFFVQRAAIIWPAPKNKVFLLSADLIFFAVDFCDPETRLRGGAGLTVEGRCLVGCWLTSDMEMSSGSVSVWTRSTWTQSLSVCSNHRTTCTTWASQVLVTTKNRATSNRHLNAKPFYIKERLSGEARKMFPPPELVLLAVTRATSNWINARGGFKGCLLSFWWSHYMIKEWNVFLKAPVQPVL